MLFKTDQPGLYLPKHLKFTDKVIETNSWHKGAKALEDGGGLSNAMRAFDEQFPTEIAPELAKPGRIAALLPKGLNLKDHEFVRGWGSL